MRIAFLGYATDAVPAWGPDDCDTGLPGSEECAVYAYQELTRRGHSVTVYMNPPKGNKYGWRHVNDWTNTKNKERYDLVLMWRRFDVDLGRRRGKVVFFWPHDSPHYMQVYPAFPRFDGVLPLSEHHRRQLGIFPGFDTIPYIIAGNGFVPEQFNTPMQFTNPYSIGYFSNYARGLKYLLVIWPFVRKEFPEATLDIYYGRETWGTCPDAEMNFMVSKIKQYTNEGVSERGKVGHQALAHAMQNTSILAYPCIATSETFCITVVKCQAAGCIPVTTRFAALAETVHPDAPTSQIVDGKFNTMDYLRVLLETLRRIRDDSDALRTERQKYIDFAKKFTWQRCIDTWLELYQRVN